MLETIGSHVAAVWGSSLHVTVTEVVQRLPRGGHGQRGEEWVGLAGEWEEAGHLAVQGGGREGAM